MDVPHKTLLAVDGSVHALAAVRHALARAGRGDGGERFVLVNVQEPASLYEVVVTHDADRIAELKRAAGADVLQPAEALLDAAGVAYETEVAGGAPEHLIAELAETYGCDAIVIGARGIGAPADTVGGLGSVALAILETSPVPVTVVRDMGPGNALEPPADEAAENGSPP